MYITRKNRITFWELDMNNNGYKIELPDDGSEAIIIRGGITVAFNASGGLVIQTNGDVRKAPTANDDTKTAVKTELTPGDKMPDGTIFAGISPDTGGPMYVTPADVPTAMNWQEAIDYAAQIDAHGHHDWSVPTKAELNAIFNNRAAIGGFKQDLYWSSTENDTNGAWSQGFGSGLQNSYYGSNNLDVRCVRRG